MDLESIVADLRNNLLKMAEQHPAEPMATIEKETIAHVPCYWLRLPEVDTDHVILYLHGGSNVLGSITSHQHLVSRIVQHTQVQALFVEYSLAPEHPFPKGFQEILAVYKALLQKVSAEKVIVMGDSAGGQQGMALLLQLKKEGIALPAGYVGLSPAFDISPETLKESIHKIDGKDPVLASAEEVNPFLALYYQQHDPKDPRISPIYGDLSNLPPLLIQVSTYEALIFQCRDFAQKIRDSGGEVVLEEYPEMMHVWQFYKPSLAESQQALVNIAQFVKEQLSLVSSS